MAAIRFEFDDLRWDPKVPSDRIEFIDAAISAYIDQLRHRIGEEFGESWTSELGELLGKRHLLSKWHR